mmetsp:Transcript_19834/g.64910  ORF Transcript_19834/g.64910 Transcript_19834/m.64910 type:complete len:379 (+) Transcript_19834:265-1401(+)
MRDTRRSMTEGGASVAREHSRYILHSWPSRTATPSTKGGLPSVRARVMDVPRKSCTSGPSLAPPSPSRRRSSSPARVATEACCALAGGAIWCGTILLTGFDSPVRSFSLARKPPPCTLRMRRSHGGDSPAERRTTQPRSTADQASSAVSPPCKQTVQRRWLISVSCDAWEYAASASKVQKRKQKKATGPHERKDPVSRICPKATKRKKKSSGCEKYRSSEATNLSAHTSGGRSGSLTARARVLQTRFGSSSRHGKRAADRSPEHTAAHAARSESRPPPRTERLGALDAVRFGPGAPRQAQQRRRRPRRVRGGGRCRGARRAPSSSPPPSPSSPRLARTPLLTSPLRCAGLLRPESNGAVSLSPPPSSLPSPPPPPPPP